MSKTGELKPAEPINLAQFIGYADNAVVSKTLINQKTGTLTLFAFDELLRSKLMGYYFIVTPLDRHCEEAQPTKRLAMTANLVGQPPLTPPSQGGECERKPRSRAMRNSFDLKCF